MIQRLIHHLRGNAVAYVALFVALGGTSYAAVSLPRNSVGTKQLRNGSVSSNKIHSGAITTVKLSSKSFGGRIFALTEIEPDGSVSVSDPKRITTTRWTEGTGGIVVFPHSVPKGCVPLAGAASSFPIDSPTGTVVPAVGAGLDDSTEVQLSFNGQFPVTLVILCGR